MLHQRSDSIEVADGRDQVRAQRVGRLGVAVLLEQSEDIEMLAALLVIAIADDHAAVGQQAADAVDPAKCVEEERVAAGADDAFVEANPPLVQRVGRIVSSAPSSSSTSVARSRSMMAGSSR